MGNRLFISYWAMLDDCASMSSFMGNHELVCDINGMEDIEKIEKYLVKYLNERDIPVSSVTIINWKVF